MSDEFTLTHRGGNTDDIELSCLPPSRYLLLPDADSCGGGLGSAYNLFLKMIAILPAPRCNSSAESTGGRTTVPIRKSPTGSVKWLWHYSLFGIEFPETRIETIIIKHYLACLMPENRSFATTATASLAHYSRSSSQYILLVPSILRRPIEYVVINHLMIVSASCIQSLFVSVFIVCGKENLGI